MNIKRKNVYLATGVLSSALLLPIAAPAQESNMYLGVGAGYYSIDGEDFLTEDDDLRDDRTGLKAFLGTSINDIFGLEIGYVDFGDSAEGPLEVEADGYTVAATLGAPLGEGIRLYGKAGQLFWDQRATAGPLSTTTDGDDPFVGVGMRFGDSTGLSVKLEYEKYELEDVDVDMPSVSLNFAF